VGKVSKYIRDRLGGGVLVQILGMFWLARNGVSYMVGEGCCISEISAPVCSGDKQEIFSLSPSDCLIITLG